MIITRYLTQEILKTTLAVFVILLFIGLSNEVVQQLTKAATGELPVDLVVQMVLLNIPGLLSLLFPIGFFVGILLALGRLSANAELAVLMASGLRFGQLLGLVVKLAVLIALLTAVLTFWIIPQATSQQEQALIHAHLDLLASLLKPGQFVATQDGKTVVFVQSLLPDKSQAKNVFMAQEPDTASAGQASWVVVSAQSAKRITDKATGQDYVVLSQGTRYEGTPGQRDYKIVRFAAFGQLLRSKIEALDVGVRMRSTRALLASSALPERVELQWRLALPMAVLIVAIMAVALTDISPRRNRYANCLPGILVVIVYSNCLILGRAWLKVGDVPIAIGFWWVHMLGLLFACVLFDTHFSWSKRLLARWRRR